MPTYVNQIASFIYAVRFDDKMQTISNKFSFALLKQIKNRFVFEYTIFIPLVFFFSFDFIQLNFEFEPIQLFNRANIYIYFLQNIFE